MTQLPMESPITRREFYLEMLVAWLFIFLVALNGVGPDGDWRDLLIPIGALAIIALHAAALWRRPRRERTSGGGAA